MKKNKPYRTRTMWTLTANDSSSCLVSNFTAEEYSQRLLCDLRDLCKRASHKNVAVCASIDGRKGSFLFDGDVAPFGDASFGIRRGVVSGVKGCVQERYTNTGRSTKIKAFGFFRCRQPDKMKWFSAGLSSAADVMG